MNSIHHRHLIEITPGGRIKVAAYPCTWQMKITIDIKLHL